MIHSSYLYIILLGVLTLQSCKPQPSKDTITESQTTLNANASGNAVWFDNFNDAQAQSIKENKPILVNFTDSDTCGLCKQLKTNVFYTVVFNEWAKNSVVLLEIDFAGKNQLSQELNDQHTAMGRSLKVTSYPTTWVLAIAHEPENNRFKVKPMGNIGYHDTPEEFIGRLQVLFPK